MTGPAHIALTAPRLTARTVQPGATLFVGLALAWAGLAAFMAGWLPLVFSVATVFLFAGPHNWFEVRYLLGRLPARLGQSRTFFLWAGGGVLTLVLAYIILPVWARWGNWPWETWLTALAVWNTALLSWLAALLVVRSRQRPRRDWTWAVPAACALIAVNWLAPQWFSLTLVYLHPLLALWFLERHLQRTHRAWVRPYRWCLCLLPLILGVLWWKLASTPNLPDDGAVAWRITQHAGAGLVTSVSSHALVTTHVFLETLHYGVWLLALPLIGGRSLPWRAGDVPLSRHPRGWPGAIRLVLAVGFCFVLLLWLGFSLDYATTRDIYFTIAITHVLVEAPFLMRML